MTALSLRCDVCNAQLRSVAEAQAHGEATGHASFSEATEAVLSLVRECACACNPTTATLAL